MEGRRNGYTLIDVLAALAVIGVLSSLVVPSVLASAARTRLADARTQLTAAVFMAQREALLRGHAVMLCPGPTGCRGDARWHAGWRVVVDADDDRAQGPRDDVIGRQAAFAPGIGLVSTAGRARLLFHPDAGNAGSNATFTLCEAHGRAPAQWLVLANDGRLRARPAPAAAGAACAAAAAGHP